MSRLTVVPQPLFGCDLTPSTSIQEFTRPLGLQRDLVSWRPAADLQRLHVEHLVQSFWLRLIDAIRCPVARLDDGSVVVLGCAMFQKDADGALAVKLWRHRDGRLRWDDCPDRDVVLEGVPAGWAWLDLLRRAAMTEVAEHLRSMDYCPRPEDLQRYGEALFSHLRRKLVRRVDLRLMRQEVAAALGLDPDAARIARRLMNVFSDNGRARLSYYNIVRRHRCAFLALERELPQLLPLYGALVEREDFPTHQWPAQALCQFLASQGVGKPAWRLLRTCSPRLLVPVRHFYWGDAGTAMLDYLNIVWMLQPQREPPTRFMWRLLSRAANPEYRFQRHLRQFLRNAEPLGHSARAFMTHPDASESDLADVLEWIEAEQPALDSQQRAAGWPWLVKRARQWLELRQKEIDAQTTTWPVPFEEWTVSEFVVRPLRSVRDLWAEARAMHHCADLFVDRCARGTVLLVSLRHKATPHRRVATALLNAQHGGWAVTQVRAAANRNPPSTARRAAERLPSLLEGLPPRVAHPTDAEALSGCSPQGLA